MSFFADLRSLTWNGVEFMCYIAIILYVAAFFGIIKAPGARNNVVEQTTNTWSNTGELLATTTDIVRQVNQAFKSGSVPPVPDIK